MYEELVKSLRTCEGACNKECVLYNSVQVDGDTCQNRLCAIAADAIEELQQTAEHYKGCADDWYKEACDYKAMLPRWIPVTEKNHPKANEPVMVVYTGWDALPHRDCTAYWSEDEGLWRWADTDDKVRAPVTYYMPLPPLPEPPKEEKK